MLQGLVIHKWLLLKSVKQISIYSCDLFCNLLVIIYTHLLKMNGQSVLK